MRIAIIVLALLLPLAAHAEEQPLSVFELRATGDIEIGPQGEVHSYKLDGGLSPPVEKLVEQSIRQWRFEPITVNGNPVIAATRMRIVLQALPTGSDGYRLRVEDVWFGDPSREKNDMQPPHYPRNAVRAGVGAKVMMVVKIDAEGNVERVHAEQVSLSQESRRDSVNQRWRKEFAEASARAAEQWSFDISETIGGNPVGTSVRVPVSYTLGDNRDNVNNTWHGFVPGPLNPIPWPTGGSVADAGATTLKDGEVRSLGSRFELETDVIGSIL